MTPQCLRTPCANRPTSYHLSEFTGGSTFSTNTQILHLYFTNTVCSSFCPTCTLLRFPNFGSQGFEVMSGIQVLLAMLDKHGSHNILKTSVLLKTEGKQLAVVSCPARYFPPPGVSAAHLSLICRLFSMMDRYLLAPIKWMITC